MTYTAQKTIQSKAYIDLYFPQKETYMTYMF